MERAQIAFSPAHEVLLLLPTGRCSLETGLTAPGVRAFRGEEILSTPGKGSGSHVAHRGRCRASSHEKWIDGFRGGLNAHLVTFDENMNCPKLADLV